MFYSQSAWFVCLLFFLFKNSVLCSICHQFGLPQCLHQLLSTFFFPLTSLPSYLPLSLFCLCDGLVDYYSALLYQTLVSIFDSINSSSPDTERRWHLLPADAKRALMSCPRMAPEIKPAPRSHARSAVAGPESQSGAALELQRGAALEPQSGAALEPQIGVALEPQSGAALEPQIGAALEPQSGAALEPQRGAALEPQSGAAPDLGPAVALARPQRPAARDAPAPAAAAAPAL